MAGLQRGGISAQPANDRFPQQRRVDIEDDVEFDIGHEPGGLREFLIELTRSPARIAGEYARPRRGVRFEDATQE